MSSEHFLCSPEKGCDKCYIHSAYNNALRNKNRKLYLNKLYLSWLSCKRWSIYSGDSPPFTSSYSNHVTSELWGRCECIIILRLCSTISHVLRAQGQYTRLLLLTWIRSVVFYCTRIRPLCWGSSNSPSLTSCPRGLWRSCCPRLRWVRMEKVRPVSYSEAMIHRLIPGASFPSGTPPLFLQPSCD